METGLRNTAVGKHISGDRDTRASSTFFVVALYWRSSTTLSCVYSVKKHLLCVDMDRAGNSFQPGPRHTLKMFDVKEHSVLT